MSRSIERAGLCLSRAWRQPARWVLLLATLVGWNAQATIRIPADPSGLGSELMLVVYDEALRMNYVKDLGLGMDDFFAQGQVDAGFQQFFVLDPASDVSWDRFLKTTSSLANATWGVFAADNVGNFGLGGRRLFTTLTQGIEANLAETSNPKVSNITGSTLGPNFLAAVNNLGDHKNLALGSDPATAAQIAINGSSLYDGSEGQNVSGDFNDTLTQFRVSPSLSPLNKIGDSSWFYYLTRSGISNLSTSRAVIDEFDNLAGDGYWGFIKESTAGSERYLLSYTLPAFTSVLEQTAGITLGNNFARMAGVLSLSSAAGKGDAVLGLAEGFLRGMANGANAGGALATPQSVLSTALTPVPEPQTWALWLGGLAWVLALSRRRAA